MTKHLLLVASSTQEFNAGEYAPYGLTEEALCALIAQEHVRLANQHPDVEAIWVNPRASYAGTKTQSVGHIVTAANQLAAAWRLKNPTGKMILVDHHTDAGGATGACTLYFSDAGKTLAEALYDQVRHVFPSKDGGVRYRSDLWILTKTHMVSALVENGPHDRTESTKHLVENPEKYAAAAWVGTRNYWNLTEEDSMFTIEELFAKLDEANPSWRWGGRNAASVDKKMTELGGQVSGLVKVVGVLAESAGQTLTKDEILAALRDGANEATTRLIVEGVDRERADDAAVTP